MSAAPDEPGPGPHASAGAPRASGVLVGVVVLLLGAVAIVAIVSGGGTEPGASSIDAEERAIERAARGTAGAVGGADELAERGRRARDAGVRAPEAGVPGELVLGPGPEETRVPAPLGPVGSGTSVVPVPPPGAAPREVTVEQEYEHTAFFLDMLVLRRDTVRRDLEEARRIGDGPRIRRLEPDEATLDAEIARFVARSHELEARMRARDEAGEPPSDEPDPPAAPPGL